MAEKILDIQGYNGGEADTPYKGPTNSFYGGSNIEIRKDTSGFELAPKLEDLGWVFDDTITCMISLKTFGINGGIIVCLENGKIYLDGVLKHTLSSGTSPYNKIYGIGVNEIGGIQYLYYVTASSFGTFQIHRSDTLLTTFTTLSDPDGVLQYSSGNPNFVQTLTNAGLLYIGVKNKVFTISNTQIISEVLVLPEKEEIRGITQYLSNYRVYTKLQETGVQYIWDGVSEFPDSRQEWLNQPILGVINDGAIDYAILGTSQYYSDLYIIQGTLKQPLRVNLEGGNRKFRQNISIREGIIYISGGRLDLSLDGIYTYGEYYPGTGRGLNLSYSMEDGEEMTHHCHIEQYSYFARTDNKVYKVSHSINPTYADSGYVISLMYQGNVWDLMSYKELKLKYKCNGGQIKIYARTTLDDTFSLLKTISDTNSKVTIGASEISSAGLGNFDEIQFKIELIKGFSGTPKVKRVTGWFIINNITR